MSNMKLFNCQILHPKFSQNYLQKQTLTNENLQTIAYIHVYSIIVNY